MNPTKVQTDNKRNPETVYDENPSSVLVWYTRFRGGSFLFGKNIKKKYIIFFYILNNKYVAFILSIISNYSKTTPNNPQQQHVLPPRFPCQPPPPWACSTIHLLTPLSCAISTLPVIPPPMLAPPYPCILHPTHAYSTLPMHTPLYPYILHPTHAYSTLPIHTPPYPCILHPTHAYSTLPLLTLPSLVLIVAPIEQLVYLPG